MTTPTIFSDVAASTRSAKVDRSGAVRSVKAVAALPATAASGTIAGMIRFQKGMSLQKLDIKTDDLDTSTNVTLDVGYVYDDNVTFTDAPAAFLSASAIPQSAGSFVWPVASGLLVATGFVAAADGYIVARTGGGATTTAGNVTMNALLSYDQ